MDNSNTLPPQTGLSSPQGRALLASVLRGGKTTQQQDALAQEPALALKPKTSPALPETK